MLINEKKNNTHDAKAIWDYRHELTDFPEFQRDLLSIVQADNTVRFIFRGQRREEWKLEPSLARELDNSSSSQHVVYHHRKSLLVAALHSNLKLEFPGY